MTFGEREQEQKQSQSSLVSVVSDEQEKSEPAVSDEVMKVSFFRYLLHIAHSHT